MLKELHESDEYYLIDYDFKHPHDPKRQEFYKELRKLLNERIISKYTETVSVIIVREFNLAEKIYELAVQKGGIANLRRAKTIRSSKAE